MKVTHLNLEKSSSNQSIKERNFEVLMVENSNLYFTYLMMAVLLISNIKSRIIYITSSSI